MARIPFLFLAVSSLWCSVSALDLKGKIQWNDICPRYSDLGSAKVVLDFGDSYGSVTRDGSFVIPDVASGTYILSVVTHDFAFDQLRVDVTSESVPEIRPYIPGTPLNPPSSVSLPYPITLAARAKYSYFAPRESFNIVGMFQNPMMLMMVFGGVMMLAMPYMMKNMDPESLEEFKAQQSKVTQMQNSLASGDIRNSLSAFLNQEEEKGAIGASSSNAKATGSGVSHNRKSGNKNKRR
ncbi:hypothetical protein PLICRDRAFT_171238 [Plicaturopsis crispa FD-325 SS-3]|nr:hypothetical protein PLICRDRAFT_171238 [Plicaturopsis crispa FD-325 SS-3]